VTRVERKPYQVVGVDPTSTLVDVRLLRWLGCSIQVQENEQYKENIDVFVMVFPMENALKRKVFSIVVSQEKK